MTQQPSAEPESGIKSLALAGIHSLLLLLLLGLANTFWLESPEEGEGSLWAGSSPQWLLMVHILFGVVVLALSVVILIKAFRSSNTRWRILAIVAVVGILLGFVGGLGYMSAGDDFASFSMAVGCVLAIGAYASGLAKS